MRMVARHPRQDCAQQIAQLLAPPTASAMQIGARPAHNRAGRTAERVTALRRLIDQLRERGEMQREHAAELLGIAPRTARAYFDELEHAGVASVARRIVSRLGQPGQPVYCLTATDDEVERFLAGAAKGPRCHRRTPLSMIGRFVHLMDDDAPFQPKLQRGPVLPDPFALPRAFFAGMPLGAA